MSKQFSICFYSHFGNGDLFNTREIIKWIMRENPQYNYFYAHSKNKRMFEDIPNLKYSVIKSFMHGMSPFVIGGANDLYFNTWIGRDGKHVLPGIGVTINEYIKMFNDSIKGLPGQFALNQLPLVPKSFMPTIDFDKLKFKNRVDAWLDAHLYDPLVLISNGNTQSNQAKNFNFDPIAESLARKYPWIHFILTQPSTIRAKNIFYTKDFIRADDAFDLNEISYLSTYVNMIVGRSSGPYVFTQVKENLENPNRIFLSFTYNKNSTDLFLGIDKECTSYWSNKIESKDVYMDIKDKICKHLLEL